MTGFGVEREAWLWRFDGDRQIATLNCYSGGDKDELIAVRPTLDRGIMSIGTSRSFKVTGDDSQQMLLLKTGVRRWYPLGSQFGSATPSPSTAIGDYTEFITLVSNLPVDLSRIFAPVVWTSEEIGR